MPQKPAFRPYELWYSEHTILFWSIFLYILISALLVLGPIRRLIVGWYNSQDWLFFGDSVLNVFFKQLISRISVELFALLIACFLGSIGGNLISILWPRKRAQENTA